MKTTLPPLLFLFAAVMFVCSMVASCALPADFGERVVTTAGTVASTMDTDGDGNLTNREVKGAGGNVALWLAVIGLLSNVGGELARRRQQNQVDELYDRTHKPVVQ